MSHAGLMQGREKLTIDAPAIAHQKAGKVRPLHHRRLFKSTPQLNCIDGDLRSAEGPHPPQLSPDLPSGLIRRPAGTTPNLLDQRLISRLPLCATRAMAWHNPPRLTRSPKASSSTAAVLP